MKNRDYHIDLIKSIAVTCVIVVHFFLNTGYYKINQFWSIDYVIASIIKSVSIICVPLFMIITGYLMCEKKLNKEYYKKIVRVLIVYVIISIFCIVCKKYIMHENIGVISSLAGIIDFTANSYSWYVNMYIGLFLIMPFLNIIFNQIKENKKYLLFFIGILLLITSIPKLLNYWSVVYPISYYFIGAYIKEYNSNISNDKLMILFLIIVIAEVLICCYIGPNLAVILNNYGSLQLALKSVAIFLILYRINIKNHLLKRIICTISKHSLSIYLFSNIIDLLVYSYLNDKYLLFSDKLQLFIIVVIIIFILSLFGAVIVDKFTDILLKFLSHIHLFNRSKECE